jgi:hypothetical protein
LKDNQSYDIREEGNNKAILPMDDFFEALKAKGVVVTPSQVITANEVMLHFGPLVPNETALCHHLCPVFATNEAEQIRFREIFAQHFAARKIVAEKPPVPPPTYFKKHWIKYILALFALCLAGFFFWYFSNRHIRDPLNITLSIKAFSGGDDVLITTDTLQAKMVAAGRDTRMVRQADLKAIYDWGDKTLPDTTGRHVYKNDGIYTIRGVVEVYFKNLMVQKDTVTTVLKICHFKNSLSINTSGVNDSIPINNLMTLNLRGDNLHPNDSIVWSIQSEFGGIENYSGMYQNKKHLFHTFEIAGQYNIFCQTVYDSSEGQCSYSTSKLVYAYDPSKPPANAYLHVAPGAKSLKPNLTVKPFWYWLFGSGILLSILLFRFVHKRYTRLKQLLGNKPLTDKEYADLLASFNSKQPPADMPFQNKNYLALPETSFSELARLMRQRIEGDAPFMNVQKTISDAINNNGFFNPVLSLRRQQSEYLVLIDENHINNQQVKLFDYLTELLRKHNVFIDKYYYRYEPSLCYSSTVPNGISLEKLSEKYPKHILLIFGHGHQLIYAYQPIISDPYLQLLNRWQYRAVLTPVSFLDWDKEEKNILPTAIPVFPVDTIGQVLLMKAIFEGKVDTIAELKKFTKDFYETENVDFEDIDELAEYCKLADWANTADGNSFNNLLFQWIAGLALYPRIQWDLTLFIGKNLLDKSGKGNELNFTSLLRIARIKWMKEGMFPTEIRLALLKKLSRPNEVLARITILEALNEIPAAEVKPGHSAYEEKEIQRITNEFNLYAYDSRVFGKYASSKAVFERLWKDKKIMETPLKNYLRNENLQWPTLINTTGAEDPVDKENISIDDYFAPVPKNIPGRSRLYKNLESFLRLFNGLCLIGLIIMLILQFSNLGSFPMFTKQKIQFKPVSFNFKDSTTPGHIKDIFVRVGDSAITIGRETTGHLLVMPSDSPRIITVAVNGKAAFDSLMTIDRNSYEVVVKDKEVERVIPQIRFILTKNCNAPGNVKQYSNIVAEVNKNMVTSVQTTSTQGQADYSNKVSDCINEICVGRGVDEKIVTELISRFKAANINLGRNQYPTYQPADGEIIIADGIRIVSAIDTGSSKNNQKQEPAKKVPDPDVYIQVSDQTLVNGAQTFRKNLMANGFKVNDVQVMAWQYNSEIYYFDKGMQQSAEKILRLYKSYRVAPLPLKAVLRITNDKKSNDNRIVVWIKKTDGAANQASDGKPEKDKALYNDMGVAPPPNAPNEPVTGETGKKIVDIAVGEIGSGENPPGSNKTKYGDWFDPKLNASMGLPWSSIFVSWVYNRAGIDLGANNYGKGFASWSQAYSYFKANGFLTYLPEPGDIVIIDLVTNTGNDKTSFHGGIFIKWIDRYQGTFETVEGNISTVKGEQGVVGKGLRNIKTQKINFVHIKDAGPKAN